MKFHSFPVLSVFFFGAGGKTISWGKFQYNVWKKVAEAHLNFFSVVFSVKRRLNFSDILRVVQPIALPQSSTRWSKSPFTRGKRLATLTVGTRCHSALSSPLDQFSTSSFVSSTPFALIHASALLLRN